MAEPRTSAAHSGDRLAEPVRMGRAGDRLDAAMTDLLLDPVARPSEQERALMLSLLTGLIGQIADELLLRLTESATQEADPAELVERLREANILARPDLVRLLVRRADAVAFLAAARTPGGGLLQEWAADPDRSIAGAAMAVVIARASTRDRFGRPGLTLADCDAEAAVALTYAVAAALDGAPEPLAAAAIDLLARHDEGDRLEAYEARLMLALDQAGRLGDATLLPLSAQGEIGLLAEGLARLARIPSAEAWPMLTGRDAHRTGRLLRLAELERPLAAGLIASLSDGHGVADPAEAMAAFDAMTPDEAADERARMRLPLAFLTARRALERHGQRGA